MEFTHEQVSRLMDALRPFSPRHATRPDLGILADPIPYLMTFRMLLVETSLGRIDILREVPPVGTHTDLVAASVEMEIAGRSYRIIGIDDLIAIKQHVARPAARRAAGSTSRGRRTSTRPRSSARFAADCSAEAPRGCPAVRDRRHGGTATAARRAIALEPPLGPSARSSAIGAAAGLL